jgi:hypothetical protein
MNTLPPNTRPGSFSQAAARYHAAQTVAFGMFMQWLAWIAIALMVLLMLAELMDFWPPRLNRSLMVNDFAMASFVFTVVGVLCKALGHMLNAQLDLAGAPGLPERVVSKKNAITTVVLTSGAIFFFSASPPDAALKNRDFESGQQAAWIPSVTFGWRSH